MTEYTIEVQTIDGFADSDFVDRLAEIIYGLDEIIDPLVGLNDDGSLDISFAVSGENAREAATRGLDAFTDAFGEAGPLRTPTVDEAKRAHRVQEELVESFSVRPSRDREKVYA